MPHTNPGFVKYLKTGYYVSRNLFGREGIFPFYASLKITSECASSCPHCYAPREAPGNDMDTDSAKTVLERLARTSILVLAFEGGEPFLRQDLGDLLTFARGLPLLTSVVTSYPDIAAARASSLSGLIDFLQISIDEGHGNMHLLDHLSEIRNAWHTRLCVQTVVTADTLDRMEEKARRARDSRSRILFLPLVPIYPELTPLCPDRHRFVREVMRLSDLYGQTVISSLRFLRGYERGVGCTTSTVVIDSDGGLFYPCHILRGKPFSLLRGHLHDFLVSAEAASLRAAMARCRMACGWYQYFALSLASLRDLPADVLSARERINDGFAKTRD